MSEDIICASCGPDRPCKHEAAERPDVACIHGFALWHCGKRDPVHRDAGEWWFWEETWADRSGPFDTEEEAREACNRYAKEVLG